MIHHVMITVFATRLLPALIHQLLLFEKYNHPSPSVILLNTVLTMHSLK